MEEEFTTAMHEELSVTKSVEEKLRAGCVWHYWCDKNSTKEEVEKYAKMYSISYDVAIKWKKFWLRKYGKDV